MSNINNSQNISISNASNVQIGNIEHKVNDSKTSQNHETPNKNAQKEQIKDLNTSTIFKILVERYNISELKTLYFSLGIDHESVNYDTKDDLARELVAYCQRHDQTSELKAKILTASSR